jgi:hypothetical protein
VLNKEVLNKEAKPEPATDWKEIRLECLKVYCIHNTISNDKILHPKEPFYSDYIHMEKLRYSINNNDPCHYPKGRSQILLLCN